MPSHLKFRDGQTKYLFKQVVKHLLPAEIVMRRKTPMPIPRDPETLIRHTRLTRELVCASDARTRAVLRPLARAGLPGAPWRVSAGRRVVRVEGVDVPAHAGAVAPGLPPVIAAVAREPEFPAGDQRHASAVHRAGHARGRRTRSPVDGGRSVAHRLVHGRLFNRSDLSPAGDDTDAHIVLKA